MVALITTTDIEDALGRAAEDATEETRWQFYIDAVSDYIDNYVDVSFEKITETVRLRANWSGRIELPGKPIHSITSVIDFRTGQPDFYVDWDGISELFNLDGGQVVDITYVHGLDQIPRDIKNLALSSILGLINEGDPTELRSFQVGDVREDYRDNFFQALFGEIGMVTLHKYCQTSYTIDAGGTSMYPNYMSRGFLND